MIALCYIMCLKQRPMQKAVADIQFAYNLFIQKAVIDSFFFVQHDKEFIKITEVHRT